MWSSKFFLPNEDNPESAKKAAELFQQEARRLDELGHHPQIPRLLAYFEQDQYQYLVQEFIDGQNLEDELWERGVFSEAQIWQLLTDLLPVLAFIHRHQVIHRDIKPDNIIRRRSDGQMVLVDFGAAKVITTSSPFHTGTQIGTPEYTAPEQAMGKALFASDLYSLGATCIHLLTQMSPQNLFDDLTETWIWQRYTPTPVSGELAQILNQMLAKVPVYRYSSVAEVLEEVTAQTTVTQIRRTTSPSASALISNPDLVQIQPLDALNPIATPLGERSGDPGGAMPLTLAPCSTDPVPPLEMYPDLGGESRSDGLGEYRRLQPRGTALSYGQCRHEDSTLASRDSKTAVYPIWTYGCCHHPQHQCRR